MPRRSLVALVCLLFAFTAPAHTAEQQLIAPGSAWRYNDSGANLGTAWRTPAYNDASWAQGSAQLGYGDGDEATVIGYGTSATQKYVTTYFRRAFTVTSPAAFTALALRFVRDDGCVIYLNGVEVARSNMPTGTISASTLSPVAVGGADESTWFTAAVDPSLLVAGTNVVAVEVHQQARSSTDVSFDLELRATEAPTPVPTVTLRSPANLSVSNQPAVTFVADVAAPAGLASATLFIGSAPQTAVFTGPAQVFDAEISADAPATANGSSLSVNVDGQAPHAHALLKFPTLVGAGGLPAAAIVSSATLQLACTNAGNTMRVYRLTQDWVEDQATWTSPATGAAWAAAGADGPASNTGVFLPGDCTATGLRSIDLTQFVQEWAAGAANYGVVLVDSGTDGIDFGSSESASAPVLSVVYRTNPQPLGTQSLSGTSAQVSFSGTLPIGQTWFWNVEVTDSAGRRSWAASDFQLTVDVSAPDAPALLAPGNGSTLPATTATLAAAVTDPAGGSLTATAEIRRAAPPEFTIIALPDTQHYSEAFPSIFTAQTQWIVANKAARNIVFVTHEGDIVEHNSLVTEWDRANTSLSLLDGVVPYGMGPGNHDQPTTLYNQYFPYTRYQPQPWYGGHYQDLNDNNYQLFSGGGMDFVIVHMAFCPPADAVSWADGVFKAYPNRIGIMTTHGYLGAAAERSVHSCTSTQYLWDGLADNPNLRFMLSGHVHAESRRTDTGAGGQSVHQMLADYQDRANGGEGWLRILRFVPAENTVYVQTYSPWLNRYETDADSQFSLPFPMGGSFTPAGTATVASGGTASWSLPGLEPHTTYEWRVTVTNAHGKSRTGPVWRFTTGAVVPVNLPPAGTGESYTMTQGATLTVAAPGVLANDSDPEGAVLNAQLESPPVNGVVTLGPAGGFAYTPAASYTGTDSFTYRASDGAAVSAPVTVAITVDPPPSQDPVIVFSATFDTGADGFTYADNTFRGATQSAYASGSRLATGGYTGGGLRVLLGGLDAATVGAMSGGFRRTFTLAAAKETAFLFVYNLDQGADYEADDVSQMLVSVNGVLVGQPGVDYVAQVTGNGNGGGAIGTGWQLFTANLGVLPAGTYTLTVGGYNNKKNGSTERTTIFIDEVHVLRAP